MKRILIDINDVVSKSAALDECAKEDIVYIISEEEDPAIPFSVFLQIKNCKGKIEMVKKEAEPFAWGFKLGSLLGNTADIVVLSKGDEFNVLKSVKSTEKKPAATRKRRKNASANAKSDSENSIDNDFMNKPVVSKKETDESDDFDAVYSEFEKKLKELSTEKEDLTFQATNIASALKIVDEKGVSLEDALKECCYSPMSEKVYSLIKNRKDIIDIARKLNTMS